MTMISYRRFDNANGDKRTNSLNPPSTTRERHAGASCKFHQSVSPKAADSRLERDEMQKRNSQAIPPVERVLIDASQPLQRFEAFGEFPVGLINAVVDVRCRDVARLVGRLVAVRVSVNDICANKSSAKITKWLQGLERVDLYWLGKRREDGAYPLLPFRPGQRVRTTRGQHEGRWSILGTVLGIESILYAGRLSRADATAKAA